MLEHQKLWLVIGRRYYRRYWGYTVARRVCHGSGELAATVLMLELAGFNCRVTRVTPPGGG